MSSAVYIRKKFDNKRKWIRVGKINWKGEFVLEIPEADLRVLNQADKMIYSGDAKILSKYF
jgi:hypothetical protein